MSADIIDLFTGEPPEDTPTRADALASGTLVDASRRARAIGFLAPVALTRPTWALHIAGTEGKDRDTRWHNILYMALLACARAKAGQRIELIPFTAYVANREVGLVAHIGPGDTAEPVITILLPEEL